MKPGKDSILMVSELRVSCHPWRIKFVQKSLFHSAIWYHVLPSWWRASSAVSQSLSDRRATPRSAHCDYEPPTRMLLTGMCTVAALAHVGQARGGAEHT